MAPPGKVLQLLATTVKVHCNPPTSGNCCLSKTQGIIVTWGNIMTWGNTMTWGITKFSHEISSICMHGVYRVDVLHGVHKISPIYQGKTPWCRGTLY